jgi:dTDP-glucose pyrophosphorylase
MNRKDITVIIPAAGRVPEGILALSNLGTVAMIPVGGRPLIHWTIEYLVSLGLTRYRIAVPREGLFVEDYIATVFGESCEVDFMVPDSTREGEVGDTIRELVEGIETRGVLIVLGDTYFRFTEESLLDSCEPFLLVHPVDDSYRWCVAEIDEKGFVKLLRDKDPTLQGMQIALIGVYFFPEAFQLRGAAFEAAKLGRGSTQLASILMEVSRDKPIRAVRAGEWLDCGNSDRQASSHRTLLQSREFNELSINPVLGTITKRSRFVEKFVDEINYLRLLPRDLAVLFPRVVDYSTDWDSPHLTMEYYGYPNLSEVFLFENVDPGIWEQVFSHLFEIVTLHFMRHPRPISGWMLGEMLINKTKHRLGALPERSPLKAIVDGPETLEINGRQLQNFGQVSGRVEKAISEMSDKVRGCVIHGDFCFSNILYDLRGRLVKLIDPRGSFGTVGIYGDPRYDIAKLYHSVYGGYDFIVNDLFSVSHERAKIRLDIRALPRHSQIRERFERVFFTTFDRQEIMLFTALLFISMPLLHYDKPRRQLAMYARGLQLLDEWLRGASSESEKTCVSASI